MNERDKHRLSEQGVQADFQRQPHLFMRLAENAFTVAESLRSNYFHNTASFITALRQTMHYAALGQRDPVLAVGTVTGTEWEPFRNEVITFIDGGVGQVQISSQIPILLRVGSYCVRTGERRLAEREQFGYYPVILGDLEGGSKDRKDFVDIVRITAELLGGLSALERTPDLRVLMFHGPLIYTMWHYMGHTPFTEKDIDLFLTHYASDPSLGQQLKDDFLQEAYLELYPGMTERYQEWYDDRLFEPLSWIAFLYRKLIATARQRTPVPLICGVVERGGNLREFCEQLLLKRVFDNLRRRQQQDYFNQMYGRSDLTSPKALLDRLNYTDSLLLAMLLEVGQYSEPWSMSKQYDKLNRAEVALPNKPGKDILSFAPLQPGSPFGFPKITGCYVHISDATEPIRVEVFSELGTQIEEVVKRVYLYSRLLPGYGFPVGLDIADKHAHVPNWLTDAYGKLIRHQLGVSLQSGEINDTEMRRILVQAIYMTHRDLLFRPEN